MGSLVLIPFLALSPIPALIFKPTLGQFLLAINAGWRRGDIRAPEIWLTQVVESVEEHARDILLKHDVARRHK